MAAPVQPIIFDMKATFGDSDPFFSATNPTPPAKLEYLVSLELLVRGAVTTPYAGTGLNTNHNDKAGTYWFWAHIFAPATISARIYVTRVPTFTSGPTANATVRNTKTDPGSGDRIDIPPGMGDAGESTDMGELVRIDKGGTAYDIVGPANGDDRKVEVEEAKAPVLEEFEGTLLFGVGFEPFQSLDLNAL